MKHRSTSGAALLATFLAAVVCTICDAASAADYAVVHRFIIGGKDGWDYLTYDAVRNRLFISRSDHVQIVDPNNGKVLDDIPDTPGVHGIALAEDVGKGFISNGRGNSVTVFDLKSLRTVGLIRTEGGENPDFILYEPISHRVLTFNGRSHNASVIDAIGGKLVATIPLDGKPEAAVADGTGMVDVNIEDKNEITKLDAKNGTVVTKWPIRGCEEPAALALDTQTRKLFVGCQNQLLAIVDADNGGVVGALPIGAGVDAAAFDAIAKLTFSSQGDGTLTVIGNGRSGTYEVVQQVATQRGARTLALNPNNHDIYLVTAEFEEASSSSAQPRQRRVVKEGTFTLLVVSERGPR